jgi:hypothetical protein
MEDIIRCLVDPAGHVYAMDGTESYTQMAAQFGLDEPLCHEFRFDLETRRLLVDRGTPEGVQTVRAYLDERLGTPEKLMQFARDGGLAKHSLTRLLARDRQASYLDACAAIERTWTEQCPPASGPCLESGCALEGQICLQPLLRAATRYRQVCGAEWASIFSNPLNRVGSWIA